MSDGIFDQIRNSGKESIFDPSGLTMDVFERILKNITKETPQNIRLVGMREMAHINNDVEAIKEYQRSDRVSRIGYLKRLLTTLGRDHASVVLWLDDHGRFKYLTGNYKGIGNEEMDSIRMDIEQKLDSTYSIELTVSDSAGYLPDVHKDVIKTGIPYYELKQYVWAITESVKQGWE